MRRVTAGTSGYQRSLAHELEEPTTLTVGKNNVRYGVAS